jgi:hypothetical protein
MDCFVSMPDIGKICSIVDPDAPPAIVGSGILALHLAAEGKTFPEALEKVSGHLTADCANGSIDLARPLRAASGDGRLAPLLKKLEKLSYGTLDAHVRMESPASIFVDRFDVIGPEICLEAHGNIRNGSHQPFGKAHILMDMQVSVSGELGKIYHDLQAPHDENGIKSTQTKKFIVGGTVNDPDYSNLMEILR